MALVLSERIKLECRSTWWCNWSVNWISVQRWEYRFSHKCHRSAARFDRRFHRWKPFSIYILFSLDIDECANGENDCHSDAECLNDIGSFFCVCRDGFKELKEGRLCLKKDEGKLLDNFHHRLNFDLDNGKEIPGKNLLSR